MRFDLSRHAREQLATMLQGIAIGLALLTLIVLLWMLWPSHAPPP